MHALCFISNTVLEGPVCHFQNFYSRCLIYLYVSCLGKAVVLGCWGYISTLGIWGFRKENRMRNRQSITISTPRFETLTTALLGIHIKQLIRFQKRLHSLVAYFFKSLTSMKIVGYKTYYA